MAPYDQNIPQATDRVKDSQSALLANFQAIKTLVDVNHETFGSANEGKHAKVDLTDQTSSAPTPGAGQIVLYNADDVASGSGRKELWANNNSALVYPITAGVRSAQGWARIGGGVYLVWGSQTSDANTSSDTTIDLTHCPASGTILSIQATPNPPSVSGTDNDYVIQVTSIPSVAVGVFTKSASSATRLASKRFTFTVIRL